MNNGSLNSYTLNSSVVDASARSALIGYANGLANVLLRGSFRDPTARDATASAVPVVVAMRRSPMDALASAQTELTIRMLARSVIDGLVLSGYKLYDLAHRIRIVTFVQATALVMARVLRVNRGAVESAYGSASVSLLRMVRSNSGRMAMASASIKAKSIPRGYQSAPFPAFAQAVAEVNARVMYTNPTPVQAMGDGLVQARAFVFFAVSGATASAIGYIGSHVVIRYRFDELALPENSFIVPFEENTFYVR